MKKVKLIIATLLVVAIGAAIFWACEKENVDSTLIKQKNFNSNGLMYFSNFEEFSNTLDMLLTMDFNELCSYENLNAYTSFGRECEELYINSLEVDSLSTDEEIQNFVDEHSDRVQIFTDYDNEQLYVPILFDHPFRYVINNNRMFQIDSTIYKVFNSGIVSTSSNNYNDLLDLSESNLQYIDSNSIFQYIPNSTPYIMFEKDLENILGMDIFIAKINGNERVRLRLIVSPLYYAPTAHPYYYYKGTGELRGFRLIGNNWCYAKRTLGCNFNYTIHYWTEYYNNSTQQFEGANYYNYSNNKSYTASVPIYKYNFATFPTVALVNRFNISDNFMIHYGSVNGCIHIPAVWYSFNIN